MEEKLYNPTLLIEDTHLPIKIQAFSHQSSVTCFVKTSMVPLTYRHSGTIDTKGFVLQFVNQMTVFHTQLQKGAH